MFNLFRRKTDPDIYCAVPQGGALPVFLDNDGWEFDGKVQDGSPSLAGFDLTVARTTSRSTGYYLFEVGTQASVVPAR